MPDDDAGQPTEPSQPTEPTGRDRLVRALLRPTWRQLVVAVLLGLVGFATVVQVRDNEVDDTFAGYREQDLIDVLNGLAATTRRAQTEIERLEDTRDQLQSDTESEEVALNQAQDEADTLAVLAGTVPVTGPGVRITITEGARPVQAGTFLNMVEELRTAGAEAMQVNGEVRIVAQTSFSDTEGGLLIGGELVSAPYVVDVIGEPGTLSGAMNFLNGPRVQLENRDGADVEVDELTSLDIESTREPVQPEFAQPPSDE